MRNSDCRRKRVDLNDLQSFVHVVELGTITAAARAEGVPKSTISRRIARLEDELSRDLLRRSGRSFSVTDDGRLLHARALGALAELSAIEMDLAESDGKPHGRLVVSAPQDLGRAATVVGFFAEYRRRWPDVQLELRLENRMVDFAHDGVDVALRAHGDTIPGGSGLMTRSLARSSSGFFAAPSYIAERGAPRTLSALKKHTLAIHSANRDRPLRFSSGGETVPWLPENPAFVFNDFGALQTLAESGAAIVALPHFACLQAVADGTLVAILKKWSTQSGGLSLVWPATRHLAPRVRAFVDLAVDHLQEELTSPLACRRPE